MPQPTLITFEETYQKFLDRNPKLLTPQGANFNAEQLHSLLKLIFLSGRINLLATIAQGKSPKDAYAEIHQELMSNPEVVDYLAHRN